MLLVSGCGLGRFKGVFGIGGTMAAWFLPYKE